MAHTAALAVAMTVKAIGAGEPCAAADTASIFSCTTVTIMLEATMAYDEALAQRIRAALNQVPGLIEKKMFGGIGFLIEGNMACGVNGNNLIVRISPDNYAAAIAQPFVRMFDMTGRPMKGWIVVDSEGVQSAEELTNWVQQGVTFAQSLPPK